jgi:aminoglycoside phosphotransferase (APT) family kinase protein
LISEQIGAGLAEWLSAQRGYPVEVRGLEAASAGARRFNALFEVVPAGAAAGGTGGDTEHLALTLIPNAAIQLIEVKDEAEVRTLAERAGVPVPRVEHVCTDESVLGGPFFISRAVEGETVPRRLLRLAHDYGIGDQIVSELGEAMARLHSIDPAEAPITLPRPTGSGPVDTAMTGLDTLLDALIEPSPTFSYGVRWLERNAPSEPRRCTIVHTDIRTGNIIVGPDGLRAVLDWETARIGDPAEDLAWPCQRMWRFRMDELTVAGLATVEVLRAGYLEAGGAEWDEDRFRWWRVLGTVRWGLSLAGQARAHLDGSFRSILMAASGRRVAELEYDSLLLLRPDSLTSRPLPQS